MGVYKRQTPRVGEPKVRCDRSGLVFNARDMRREWNNLIVHKDFYEPRHPQEFVRGVRDDQAVRHARVQENIGSALSTTSSTATTTKNVISFVSASFTTATEIARVKLVVTDTGLDSYKDRLVFEISDDGSTWKEAGTISPGQLADLQSGETSYYQIGKDTKNIRLIGRFAPKQAVDYTLTMTLIGGDKANVSVSDL